VLLGLITISQVFFDFPLVNLGDAEPNAADSTAEVGAFEVGDIEVQCGKTWRDVGEMERKQFRGPEGLPPIKGQLCFADADVRNATRDAQLVVPTLIGILVIGDGEFPAGGATVPAEGDSSSHIESPLLFPDQQVRVRWYLDIPTGVSPRLLIAESVDRGGDRDRVTFDIP
jgi:hypothetical protein